MTPEQRKWTLWRWQRSPFSGDWYWQIKGDGEQIPDEAETVEVVAAKPASDQHQPDSEDA